MGGSSTSNYEYFCGANVSISFNGNEQFDIAGISYQITDSSTPIYGYASRTFDAVAPGQKLVRGNFVVNFTEFNAVAKDIASTKFKVKAKLDPIGIEKSEEPQNAFDQYSSYAEQHLTTIASAGWIEDDQTNGPRIKAENMDNFIQYVTRVMYSETHDDSDAVSLGLNLLEYFSIEKKPTPYVTKTKSLKSTLDALLLGPFNISITFGDPNHPDSSFTIVNCYVNSIGGTIQISEDVLLQEYSFYGRNVIS